MSEATATEASVPDVLDQSETADLTAVVSASPELPMRTLIGPDPAASADPLVAGLLKPEPQALSARAPTAAAAPVIIRSVRFLAMVKLRFSKGAPIVGRAADHGLSGRLV